MSTPAAPNPALMRAVYLGLALLLLLLAVPYLVTAFHLWGSAGEFSGFDNYQTQMEESARTALLKGGISLGGAVWMLLLWRAQPRNPSN